MSAARTPAGTTRLVWGLPLVSIALGALFSLPAGASAYLVGLTLATTLAAGLIAVDDHHTGLLQDRWTGPFTLAGLIQVFLASAVLRPWAEVAAPCLLGAVITTSLYLVLGLLGWVGFGDVKFAAGLALLVAIPAGWAGLYLLPLALVISALQRLLRRVALRPEGPRSAHGPALAAALAILMLAACLPQN